VTELTLGFRVPREILDYAARLLPSIAPGLAAPQSLRSGAGSLSVRPVSELLGAAVAACREALTREGSIGLITADAAAPTFASALAAAGLEYGVLGPESNGSGRLLLIPASLAKGLEYDHVVLAEPSDIVAAEDRGIARLYVCLTRAVTTLTVLHTTSLPEPLSLPTS
jgi:DNA helicase IV